MIKETSSLWNDLAQTEKPILLYGTGNGADKILDAFERYGIKIDAIFASDGFVRSREFHSMPVRAYSDVINEYGMDINVILAFGTTVKEVREFIEMLDKKHNLIIPDVPLYGGEIFDYEYYLNHKDIIDETRELLCDERSKDIYDDIISFRLSGKLEYLLKTDDTIEVIKKFYSEKNIKTVIDGGAFKGDTAEQFIEAIVPDTIIAVEGDTKTASKLALYADSETRAKVVPLNCMLGCENKTVTYIASSSRGSGENGRNRRAKEIEVEMKTIDSIAEDTKIDLIKLDVEGSEYDAIIGSEEIIKRDNPCMMVSLYHKTDDFYLLTKMVHELMPEKKLYIRRVDCIPMWDIILYAV